MSPAVCTQTHTNMPGVRVVAARAQVLTFWRFCQYLSISVAHRSHHFGWQKCCRPRIFIHIIYFWCWLHTSDIDTQLEPPIRNVWLGIERRHIGRCQWHTCDRPWTSAAVILRQVTKIAFFSCLKANEKKNKFGTSVLHGKYARIIRIPIFRLPEKKFGINQNHKFSQLISKNCLNLLRKSRSRIATFSTEQKKNLHPICIVIANSNGVLRA